MLELNKTYSIKITDMGTEGEGIGRAEGITVFVQGAIPGDTAEVEITQLKKNFAKGQVVSLEEPSPSRVDPPCRYFDQCGGCSLQNMRYEDQLKLKRRQIMDKLVRIGGIEDPKVNAVMGMKEPFRYRNKAHFPIFAGGIKERKDGSLVNTAPAVIGFYKRKSHEVVDCKKCLIQSEVADKVAQAMREYIKADKVTVYDEKTGRGRLRNLIVKTGLKSREVMVIIVSNGEKLSNRDKLVSMLKDAVDSVEPKLPGEEKFQLKSVVINVNKKKHGPILSETCVTIFGQPVIRDYIGGMEFEISPLSFYQVNPVQMKRLYNVVLEYSHLTGEETALDLYCGVGSIGLYCASRAKYVWGIESVKNAVLDANRNAVINGIVNAQFICGKVEDELPKLAEKGVKADLVILDPPRSGCHPSLLDAVADQEPKRIIYVSCDPGTMARDLKALTERGYHLEEVQPVDMFAQTMTVECVCSLTRK